MYVVLMGCGRVGSNLATSLAADGHDVVVVDKDPGAFTNLGSAFNGMTMTGTGIDVEVLRRAGAEQADAFAAVTSLDNANIMASQIARRIFNVPKVIARINDVRKRDAYEAFGVETICPTDLGAGRLRLMLEESGFQSLQSLGAGEVVLGRLTVSAELSGKRVDDLELPGKIRVCSIERGAGAEVPRPEVTVQTRDRLLVTVRRDFMRHIPGLVPTPEGGRR